MSVFRRRREEPTPAAAALPEGEAPTTVPVARDPDLAVPPFRPAPSPAQAPHSKDAAMNMPQKPGQPGMGVPPRPMPMAGTGPLITPGGGARPAPAPERRSMVVGKGISLQGTVTDAERLVVEGTVESQMMHAAELMISHSGVFKGEVEVDDAEIAGIFDGTLTVRGNLIIRATGKVMGNARCRRLQVEEGGQVSGRMEMLGDAGPAPAPHMAMPMGSSDVEPLD